MFQIVSELPKPRWTFSLISVTNTFCVLCVTRILLLPRVEPTSQCLHCFHVMTENQFKIRLFIIFTPVTHLLYCSKSVFFHSDGRMKSSQVTVVTSIFKFPLSADIENHININSRWGLGSVVLGKDVLLVSFRRPIARLQRACGRHHRQDSPPVYYCAATADVTAPFYETVRRGPDRMFHANIFHRSAIAICELVLLDSVDFLCG